MPLSYNTVAEAYARLEGISGRNELTEVFAGLLKDTPKQELPMLVYLTQGKLRPDFEGVEIGVAEKMALRALTTATGLDADRVYQTYVKLGDIGSAAEKTLEGRKQGTLFSEPLTLGRVYETLLRMSRTGGEGSVETKQR